MNAPDYARFRELVQRMRDAQKQAVLPAEYHWTHDAQTARINEGLVDEALAAPAKGQVVPLTARLALVAASHALKSYAFGNASPELAVEVAAACDEALAALDAQDAAAGGEEKPT